MPAKSHLTLAERAAYRSLEDVIGCKWSAGVLAAVHQGVRRPGELERYVPGISKKVLQERLHKLLDYRLVTRSEGRDGRRPRVEYALTPTGRKLARLIENLRELQAEHNSRRAARAGD
jgi:DNA-binding HxlR family transcriptional regulator